MDQMNTKNKNQRCKRKKNKKLVVERKNTFYEKSRWLFFWLHKFEEIFFFLHCDPTVNGTLQWKNKRQRVCIGSLDLNRSSHILFFLRFLYNRRLWYDLPEPSIPSNVTKRVFSLYITPNQIIQWCKQSYKNIWFFYIFHRQKINLFF